MYKIEYNSLYKFIVSIGISLISLSIFLWFKEPYGLMFEVSKIEKLTPRAQGIIESRQKFIGIFFECLPYISLATITLGVFLIIIGMALWWHKQQKALDKNQDLQNKKLEKEIEPLNESDILKRTTKDVKEDISLSNELKTQITSASELIEEYMQIDNLASDKIGLECSFSHNIFRNKRLGKYEYDLILERKTLLTKDYIVEIKYVKKPTISRKWLLGIINLLKELSANYQEVMNRAPKKILLIVTISSNKSKIKGAIEQFTDSLPIKDIGIKVVSSEELKCLDYEINITGQ